MPKGIEPKGKDTITRRIVRLFERVRCPAQLVLKTPRAGDEVDNGYGVDFDLPSYAVIHKGDIYSSKAAACIRTWQRLQWQKNQEEIEILKFNVEGVTSLKGLVEELGHDGFEIMWKREGVEL